MRSPQMLAIVSGAGAATLKYHSIAETPKTDSNVQEKWEEGCSREENPRGVTATRTRERWLRQPTRPSRGDGEQFPELASRVSGVLGSMHFSGVRAKAKVQGCQSHGRPSVGASPLGNTAENEAGAETRVARTVHQANVYIFAYYCVCECVYVCMRVHVYRGCRTSVEPVLSEPLCGFQE